MKIKELRLSPPGDSMLRRRIDLGKNGDLNQGLLNTGTSNDVLGEWLKSIDSRKCLRTFAEDNLQGWYFMSVLCQLFDKLSNDLCILSFWIFFLFLQLFCPFSFYHSLIHTYMKIYVEYRDRLGHAFEEGINTEWPWTMVFLSANRIRKMFMFISFFFFAFFSSFFSSYRTLA